MFKKTILFSLFLILASTVPAFAQDEQSDDASGIASIEISVIEGGNNPLQGIRFKCREADSSGSIITSKSFDTDRDGSFIWETQATSNNSYVCEAESNFPACFVPPSTDQSKVVVTDLQAGQIRRSTLVWVFEAEQEYMGTTCGEYFFPSDPDGELSEVAKITLPAGYSVSPYLGNLTVAEARSVKGLTISYTGTQGSFSCTTNSANNAVKWTDSLDLNDERTINFLKNLNSYVTLDTKGYLRVNVDSVPELSGNRELYMNHLNLITDELGEPIVFVDGLESTKSSVSDVKYSKSVLQFSASSGVEYMVSPQLEVTQCTKSDLRKGECVIKGNVDNLCSFVTLLVEDGDTSDIYEIDIENDGSFEYKVEDLDPDKTYTFTVNASVSAEQETEYTWEGGNLLIGQFMLYIVFPLAIVLIIIWAIYNSKKTAKEKREMRDAQVNQVKALTSEVDDFLMKLKKKVKTVDLMDEKSVELTNRILMLSEMSEGLAEMTDEAVRKEIEEKIEYPYTDIQSFYDELSSDYQEFRQKILDSTMISGFVN